MTKKEIIQEIIEKSLDMLYQNDLYLICHNRGGRDSHVSERGIAFRFGIYFDKLVREHFSEFQVDAEYNRNRNARKALPSRPAGSFPDLILHKRGKNSGNLLVIEMKTWWNPSQEEDLQKVLEFCKPSGSYHYKYGALILIGKKRGTAKITVYSQDETEKLCEDRLKAAAKTSSQ